MFYTLEINYLCLFVGSVWVQPEQDGALPSISKFKKCVSKILLLILDVRLATQKIVIATALIYFILSICVVVGRGQVEGRVSDW